MSYLVRRVLPVIGDVVSVAYGRAASEALAAAVSRARTAGGALAPVTVVVPSNLVGVAARRLLAGGGCGRVGLANVAFVTPFRLAELLATDRLLDRRPLTDTVLAAGARAALAAHDGPFAAVAGHHTTAAAVADLFAELSQLTEDELARLEQAASDAGRPTTLAALALHRDLVARLAGFHDEAAVAEAAVTRPDLAGALAAHGQLVWYLPSPLRPPLLRLLRTVFCLAPTDVVVGRSGVAEADRAVDAVLGAVGVPVRAARGETAPTANTVVSVTDPDEEVRHVVRRIIGLVADGVPLDRIGVFAPSPDPYDRLMEQHLRSAGIPANGPSRRRLADGVAGRTLLAALELPGVGWRRGGVLALVSGAPVLFEGRLARVNRWETCSRSAGVVGGLADWRAKLARAVTLAGADLASPDERRVRRARALVEDLEALDRFVGGLATAIAAVDSAGSWSAKSDAARSLLLALLGGDGERRRWPEDEQQAADRVEDALVRLRSLDEFDPTPTQDRFLAALRTELDRPAGRVGRFGVGVTYGPLVAAVGLDLDAVFVLGCAEGTLPAPARDDGVLPDALRAAVGGALPLRAARVDDQHRAFLAALAAAPPGRRTLLFPRGDLRSGRHRLPSRWLLDSVAVLAGRPVDATSFDEVHADGVLQVASAADALARTTTYVEVDERDVAVVARAVSAGVDPRHHPAAARAHQGLTARAARRSAAFTAWDGNLAEVAASGELAPIGERPQSPSRLETWAECGFKYFLAYVLGLGERDEPEDVVVLGPLDRGSGVHTVLERFVGDAIEAGRPAHDESWTEADRATLRSLAAAVFDDYEAAGRTGRAVTWRLVRADLLARLQEFLEYDDAHRSRNRAVPSRVELAFGLDDTEPVRIDVGDGRVLPFRGKIDRVDVGADGRLHVIDYKTGKGGKYRKLGDSDPVLGGTALQLGIYAEAARQALDPDAEVHSAYWFVEQPAAERERGYRWDDGRRARFHEVVRAIVDGIAAGAFPAVPGAWSSFRATNENCTYCAFDQLCERDRGEQAERKVSAPELRIRSVLGRPEEES